jgi:DNA-binding beta-propeller fold protein YncE
MMPKSIYALPIALLLVSLLFCFSAAHTAEQTSGSWIALSKDSQQLSLDDMKYSPMLNKVMVPAGQTGFLALIDPSDDSLRSISGFSTQPPAQGTRGAGITSVDEADHQLLVTDRSVKKLDVVDPTSKKIVSSADLSAGPDYVRFVSPTNEIWVTEPRNEQIEIFSFKANSDSPPVHTGMIAVKGGPEALVIDKSRGRAYTNLDGGKTAVIDLKSKKIIQTFPNGCESAEGALLDESGKFLFVACGEGKVLSMDLSQEGKVISNVSSGSGVDIIAYNPKLKHLYIPGSKSATMGIVSVSSEGMLSLVRTVPSVEGGHCVSMAPNGKVYVCDPHHGRLLVINDNP